MIGTMPAERLALALGRGRRRGPEHTQAQDSGLVRCPRPVGSCHQNRQSRRHHRRPPQSRQNHHQSHRHPHRLRHLHPPPQFCEGQDCEAPVTSTTGATASAQVMISSSYVLRREWTKQVILAYLRGRRKSQCKGEEEDKGATRLGQKKATHPYQVHLRLPQPFARPP